jgi:hypothetical protein
MENQGLYENILAGVTILQWFKRFGAALGLEAVLPPRDYSKGLPTGRASLS